MKKKKSKSWQNINDYLPKMSGCPEGGDHWHNCGVTRADVNMKYEYCNEVIICICRYYPPSHKCLPNPDTRSA